MDYDPYTTYAFAWGVGYESEAKYCSFTIVVEDETVFTATGNDCGSFGDGEVFYTLQSTCTHEGYADGVCGICQKTCGKEFAHQFDEEHKCAICEYACGSEATPHDWSNKDGVCAVCEVSCEHSYGEDSICKICNKSCPHSSWVNNTCEECKYACGSEEHPHDWSNKDGVCAMCKATCEHSFVDGACTNCEAKRSIVINMTDSYGDGWNNAALQVYAGGELVNTATIENSNSGTEQLDYDPDIAYSFQWVQGYFDEECGFEIIVDGIVVYTVEQGAIVGWENGAVIYSLETAPSLSYHSLSLTGDIGVNFYMSLSDTVLEDETAYMKFTYADGTTETIKVADAVKTTYEGGTYYGFTANVAAKEMTDDIKARFCFGDRSTEVYTYSVKEYAETVIKAGTYDEKTVALAKALLNYGAYAQIYFGEEAADGTNLANALGVKDDSEGEAAELWLDTTVELEDGVYTSLYQSYMPNVARTEGVENTITYLGTTLRLESNVAVRHYFKVEAVVTQSEAVEGEAADGGEAQVTQTAAAVAAAAGLTAHDAAQGLYYYEIANIPVLNWGNSAGASEGTSTVASIAGYDFQYSPLSYITTALCNVQNNQTLAADDPLMTDTDLHNLLKAMYLYYQAVVAYNSK